MYTTQLERGKREQKKAAEKEAREAQMQFAQDSIVEAQKRIEEEFARKTQCIQEHKRRSLFCILGFHKFQRVTQYYFDRNKKYLNDPHTSISAFICVHPKCHKYRIRTRYVYDPIWNLDTL